MVQGDKRTHIGSRLAGEGAGAVGVEGFTRAAELVGEAAAEL